ncbi:MAG: Rieske (2Fe-2S) protein [Acidimicrobiia bacterium]|nr:Rieske (2Fe-2S) protein [Acidimicrobiia bacterium]
MAPRVPCRERRRVLKLLGEAAGGLTGTAVLLSIGCGRAADGAVTVPLSRLPENVRVRVLDGETPVELLRTGGVVRARSLWCTHSGCEVRWSEERDEYLCPCHDGIFDQDGKVVSGPPPRPLAGYPITMRGEEVVLGLEPTERNDA